VVTPQSNPGRVACPRYNFRLAVVRSELANSRLLMDPPDYRIGSDRGRSNHGITLFSKRVMAEIRSPLRVST
jgi:hypothetical protein